MRYICAVPDLQNQKKSSVFYLLLFPFLAGSVIGTIIYCNFEFSSPVIFDSIKLSFIYQPVLVFLFGCSLLGAFILPIFNLFKGFSISLFTAFILDSLNYSALLIVLIFAYYFCLLFFSHISFNFSASLFKSVFSQNFKLSNATIKRYVTSFLGFLFIFFVISIIFRLYV